MKMPTRRHWSDDSVFAFGPNGSYLYKSPFQIRRCNLPVKLEAFLNDVLPSNPVILCTALGEKKESYFISVEIKGKVRCSWNELPSRLVTWLEGQNRVTNRSTRVTLGQNDSFFAWDANSYRWGSLHPHIEVAVQDQITPEGWKGGHITGVSIGFEGSYYIKRAGVHPHYRVNKEYPEFAKVMANWKSAVATMDDEPTRVIVELHPYERDKFVMIDSDYDHFYQIHPDSLDAYLDVADSISDNETVMRRMKARREAQEKAKNKQIERENRQKLQEAKRAVEQAKREAEQAKREAEQAKREAEQAKRDAEQAKREAERAGASELKRAYEDWSLRCHMDFRRVNTLTTFPHLPTFACICSQTVCQIFKEEQALKACRHDIERFLRASGRYSFEWLKAERIEWHPDKFSRRSDPDFRKDLQQKATLMFAALGELMDDLQRT